MASKGAVPVPAGSAVTVKCESVTSRLADGVPEPFTPVSYKVDVMAAALAAEAAAARARIKIAVFICRFLRNVDIVKEKWNPGARVCITLGPGVSIRPRGGPYYLLRKS